MDQYDRQFGFDRHTDGTPCERPCTKVGTGIHVLIPPINDFYATADGIIALGSKPNWRVGQTWFNVLDQQRPDLADKIRGTDLDPFHRDDRVGNFIAWVEENW